MKKLPPDFRMLSIMSFLETPGSGAGLLLQDFPPSGSDMKKLSLKIKTVGIFKTNRQFFVFFSSIYYNNKLTVEWKFSKKNPEAVHPN